MFSTTLYQQISTNNLTDNEKHELKSLISDYVKQKYVRDYLDSFGIDSALMDDFNDYIRDWSSYSLSEKLFGLNIYPKN